MEKEYVIEFEALGCDNNCMQGLFEKKSVIEEVKDILKHMYGDRLQWFTISENTKNGIKEIYNSQN
jgi:hypothetical protein